MELQFEKLAKKKKRNYLQLLHTEKGVLIEKVPNKQVELKHIFEHLEDDPSWVFEDLTQKDTSYATHGFHKYPAKFIPQLARRCIEENTDVDYIVCDPFMGCGTTLIESLVAKRKVVGVDINPVAYLISKVKATPINPKKLKYEINRVLSDLRSYFESDNGQKSLLDVKILPVIPENERLEYWFPNEKLRYDLGIILGRIDTINDKDIRNFCLCAFSNVLKNASIWLMKSIKPTRDLNKRIDSPLKLFTRQIMKMVKGNDTYWEVLPSDVRDNLSNYLNLRKGDARNLIIENNSVSLIVTSPPYVTSYEYADLHQLSALWLGYTNSVSEFRKDFIGSIHKKESDYNGIKSELAKQEIIELSKKSKNESEAVRNYFFEMQECFEEMCRVLKRKGRTCIVIGNTELRGVPILNAQVFVEIMLNIGFKVHNIIKRKIPSKVLPQTRDSKTGRFTSKQNANRLAYSYEYILVMEKFKKDGNEV